MNKRSMIKQLITKEFNDAAEIDAFIEVLREINANNVSKHSMEWWIAAAYLYYITLKTPAPFHARIDKIPVDPPDFRITINESTIDIEAVVAVDENYEEASSYCKNKLKDKTYPTNTSFMYGAEKDKSEWENHFQKPGEPLRGPAVYGDFGRIHTANCVKNTIQNKIKRYENRETNFVLVVYVKTPSRIYCDEVTDREWVADTVSTEISSAHRFQRVDVLWRKNEVYQLT